MKLSREQFQAAIEAGIQACPEMTDAQRMMLRHVGATTTRVVHGTFWMTMHDCGCPLTQAGIVSRHPVDLSDEIRPFWETFDSQLISFPLLLEVTP